MIYWQKKMLQIIFITLLAINAQAGVKKPCHQTVEAFFHRTLNELKTDANKTTSGIRTPRLVNPQEEMEIVGDWTKVKQPKFITAILPKDTHIINHSLNGANEEGVVKTNGGIMAHVRAYVHGVGSNFGVNFYALMDNFFHHKSDFVRKEANAVVLFIHGGGTKTTGHHVAASLMNYLNPYRVDVVSLDLPWHGEGPRNSVENAADSIKLVREYIEKYITPSGKPVFIAGHSMGGVFSDVYRRLYPNDKLVKGVISLSTVADSAPGKSIKDKQEAQMIIDEFNRTNPNIPEDERDLSDSLARDNKIAPLCGAFCSTFMTEVNWTLPIHRGSQYVPGLYIIGEGDALYQGYQKSFKEFVGELKNTELVVFNKRKLFGKIKNKISIYDETLSREAKRKILAGNYFGEIDQKVVDKMSPHERFELRNRELLKLKAQGKIEFDSSIPLPELFENDPQNIGHLIFDHKPLVTFSADVPDEIRKRIMAANYYGDLNSDQLKKLTDEQKIELRSKTLLAMRAEGKVNWDPRYSVDDLNQIETFVLMRQFIEKNIGKKLQSTRAAEIKPIYNISQMYINNLIFREFADKYIYSHLRASEIIAQLGPERGALTSEINSLNKLPERTAAQEARLVEAQERIKKIIRIIERKNAKNAKDQKELDSIIEEISRINQESSLLGKERHELRSSKATGLDTVLRSELSSIEKQIIALGESLNTPDLVKARDEREAIFKELMKQDGVVRVSLEHFLSTNMVKGKYLPDLFKNFPPNVRNAFEKYEELSNRYQSSVKHFSAVLNHEIYTASSESRELARLYEEASQKVTSALQGLEHIDQEHARMATRLFKLENRRNLLIGDEHFKSEHYTIWGLLNADPEYIRSHYSEINSLLMNIWKDWQSLWGSRIAESNESLY
ncbi:MAG: alpha/beta fold hydrolase [Bacteriovorax sp.]|jgi:pimeloyl-ACP methyl ester carboxylesterase|nr:alpha/beta fold hydrolase [Bacteriovorax sp.]